MRPRRCVFCVLTGEAAREFIALQPTTMSLIATSTRRFPTAALPRALDPLFCQLAACRHGLEAETTEDRIWSLWMYHPNPAAARALDRAATEIARQSHDIAETRLDRLLRRLPDFCEAWNKLATLYFLQARDEECLESLHHVLLLEPRHFGAICNVAELALLRGDVDGAEFAFRCALRINPHLDNVRHRIADLRSH